jgi:GTP-binding protein
LVKSVVFKDRVKVTVVAGNGGDGMATFRREKYVPRGGPDGGDGGRGGHVILVASKDVDSLHPLYFQPLQRAEHGGRGGTQRCHGRNGQDLRIPVPCGTVARLFDGEDWLGEVVEPEDEFMVARGGKGGLGNCHFVSSTHQAPREFTEGEAGEGKVLRLELKLVADIGLVGYPNAGKSTLLRALTNAHPKVAAYPFTTVHPLIGTIQFEDYSQLRIADIPGLIDGAHQGVGLGHEFLRHIERTSFLIFVIDMAGVDGRHPADDYRNLRFELRQYDDALDRRPYLIVANKMDDPASDALLAEFRQRTGQHPLEVSAELGEGVDRVRDALFRQVQETKSRARHGP